MSCLQLGVCACVELSGVIPSLVEIIVFYMLKIGEGNKSREHNFMILLEKNLRGLHLSIALNMLFSLLPNIGLEIDLR